MAEKALRPGYQPLVDPFEIRVLALKKATDGNSISCQLHHTYLPAQPPIAKDRHALRTYHALSYEWGSPDDGGDFITIDGNSVWIRKNLHDALKQLSGEQDELCLWVDALCIDQENLEEKSEQVSMMGDIFRNAERVIAWLGPAKDDSDIAMDMMADSSKVEGFVQDTEMQRKIDAGECPEADAVVRLCHRSYWKRLWIIQELYLAQECVVRCGAKAVPRDEFEDSLSATQQGGEWSWDGLKWEETPANHHRLARWRRGKMTAGLRWWIQTCIQGRFQATDERDYVYALLSLAEDCQTGEIMPNYQKDPFIVFLEVINSPSFQARGPRMAYGKKKIYGDEVSYNTALALAEKMGLGLDSRENISRDDIRTVFGLRRKTPKIVNGRPVEEDPPVEAEIDIVAAVVFGAVFIGFLFVVVFLFRWFLRQVFPISPLSGV